MIDDLHKRKGYGEDATRALIDFAFTEMNLKKIVLEVLKSNERAISLYNKLGFKPVKNSSKESPKSLTMILKKA